MRQPAARGRVSAFGLTAIALTLIAAVPAACISGRVLTGYPGYPFAMFETSLPADSAFFLLQPAVESEGFPLDYTILDQGFITTRSAEMVGRPVFLTLVVEPTESATSEPAAAAPVRFGAGSRVWVAAYEETVTGALRINPLNEQVWSAVMEVSGRLSDSVGGTAPEGPSERNSS